MEHNDDELAGRRAKARARDITHSTHLDLERSLSRRHVGQAFEALGINARDLQRAAEYLSRGGWRDELTGVFQPGPGREQLMREVDRAHRTEVSLVVAFVDVIGLRRINEEQGHAAGDNVLVAVGDTLQAGLRSCDVIVRYGGDEFVCALWGSTRLDVARRFVEARRVLDAVYPGAAIAVGLAELQPDESLDEVVARAHGDLGAYRGDHASISTAGAVPTPGA